MNDRNDSANPERGGTDPERAAARHDSGGQRRAPESPQDAFERGRFGGEQGHGERGYRGQSPHDTPPGSVPGGSYGGGGGYRQGGYDQGNFDPSVERYRSGTGPRQERGTWTRSGAGPEYRPEYPAEHRRGGGAEHGGGAQHGSGAEHGGAHGGGDWRQGYGGYGMSESGGMSQGRGGQNAPRPGGIDDEPAVGYGFGGMSTEREGSPQAPQQSEAASWGEHGSPNRGSQGRAGWRSEQQWSDRSDPRGGREPGEVKWPYLEPWAVPGPFTGRGPEDWERPPEMIRNDVCERLTRHGELDARRIRVLVENGEVILEGRVESRSAKRMAEDTAESVTGVRDVQNRLRIDYGDQG